MGFFTSKIKPKVKMRFSFILPRYKRLLVRMLNTEIITMPVFLCFVAVVVLTLLKSHNKVK